MKRKFIYFLTIFIFLILSKIGYAQTEVIIGGNINLPYDLAMDSVFGGLNINTVPGGIIKEKTVIFQTWEKFNGKTYKEGNIDSVLELYGELHHGSLNMSSMIDFDAIDSLAQLYYTQTGNIPLLCLNYTYAEIKPNAFSNGWLTQNGLRIINQTPGGQTPFDTKTMFAFSPLINDVPLGSQNFVLLPQFNLTNKPLPTNLEVDLADGLGYRNITIGEVITSGFINSNIAKLRAVYLGDTLIAYSPVNINLSSSASSLATRLDPDRIETFSAAGNTHQYGVWNSCESGFKIRKPFIVVEGFDPGNDRTLNKNEFLTCNAIDYEKATNLYELANAQGVADDLRNAGYEVVILNYEDGTKSIQDKASTVIELIRKLNIELAQSGSKAELSFIAPSEAGLVVRYALAEMEGNNEYHNTKLYISFDAPHQGANVPLSLQHYLDFFFWTNPVLKISKKTNSVWKLLKITPTEQMLRYSYRGGAGTVRDNFKNSIEALNGGLGYPIMCRKVAISNGGGNGVGQGYTDGSKLFGFNLTTLFINNYSDGWALTSQARGKVFEGNSIKPIKLTTIMPFWNRTVFERGREPLDNCPGGKQGFMYETDKTIKENLGDIASFIWKGNLFSPDRDFQTFIPTISSLDLRNTSDLSYNIHENLTLGLNEAFNLGQAITPFDAIYVAPSNDRHVICSTTPNIATFLINEIMPYNLFLQNKTNNRALDYEARDNITVGRNVSNRITQGDYIVNHTSGEFKIRAGNQIELKQGTVITPTGTGSVKIFLDDIEASCRPANREIETKEYNLTYNGDNNNLLPKNNYAFKNYPNPFSTNTTFEYQLSTASMIELSLYNLQGIKVDEIEVLNKKEVGNYSINYNAKDLASGFYIGVLKVDGNITNTIKVQLFN